MNARIAPAGLLATPADGNAHWSITTLAAWLCVPPATVDAQIATDEHGNSADFHGPRHGRSYDNAAGEDRGDCWLTTEAAERIAAALPTGILARLVAADQPEAAALLGWDQIHALAQHIVEHTGGQA